MKTEFRQIELIKTPPQYRADVEERFQDFGELPPLDVDAALALASASALYLSNIANGGGLGISTTKSRRLTIGGWDDKTQKWIEAKHVKHVFFIPQKVLAACFKKHFLYAFSQLWESGNLLLPKELVQLNNPDDFRLFYTQGFQKIRYYGIYATDCRTKRLAQIAKTLGNKNWTTSIRTVCQIIIAATGINPNICSACGGETLIVLIIPPTTPLSINTQTDDILQVSRPPPTI